MLQSAHVQPMQAILSKYERTFLRPQARKMYISLGSARIHYVARERSTTTIPKKYLSPKCSIKTKTYEQIIGVHNNFMIIHEWQWRWFGFSFSLQNTFFYTLQSHADHLSDISVVFQRGRMQWSLVLGRACEVTLFIFPTSQSSSAQQNARFHFSESRPSTSLRLNIASLYTRLFFMGSARMLPMMQAKRLFYWPR